MGTCCSTEKKQHKQLIKVTNDSIKLFSLKGGKVWGKIVDVYDGDTFKVVFFMDNKLVKFNIRGYGYDTPELRPSKKKIGREMEISRAKEARHRLVELICAKKIDPLLKNKQEIQEILSQNKRLVYLRFFEFGKYGRLLASVFNSESDKQSFGDILIAEKLAVPYFGGKKVAYDIKPLVE